MMKRFLTRSTFLKFFFVACACIMCALPARAANEWWRLRVVTVRTDGAEVASLVAVGEYNTSLTPAKNEYTMTSACNGRDNAKTKAYVGVSIEEKDCEVFRGWYYDPACTQLISDSRYVITPSTDYVPLHSSQSVAEEPANLVTIYALFSEPICWEDLNVKTPTPAAEGENYYAYNLGAKRFVSLGNINSNHTQYGLLSTTDANNALLFTLTPSENSIRIAADINGTLFGLKPAGTAIANDETRTAIIEDSVGYCRVKYLNIKSGKKYYNYYWTINSSGTLGKDGPLVTDPNTDNVYRHWLFIPEQTYLNQTKVKSAVDGSVNISTPEGSGTAYVRFNVSELGDVSKHFTYSLSNSDHWVMGDPARDGDVITVPVTYTAQGASGSFTTTVTMANKGIGDDYSYATATATANVVLDLVCSVAVSALDWSTKQGGEEIYNVGMEVAASQRERLRNKLVYNGSDNFVRNLATWTATITGTNANQFKFANGTQSVSGLYSPELLDVIYAPTVGGTHTATLTVEVSYTDANDVEHTSDPVTVTLSGKAQNVSSMITMALNGSETFTSKTHEMGDIIGTNWKNDTVDLYIHGVTNLTKSWSASEGAFEFDENSINLDEANQRLIIRARRSTAVTVAAEQTATLTISGKDGSSNDVSATLIIKYNAKPFITPTVTWNWEELYEDATYTDPLSTNSNGAWTLEQRDGNGGMTYNAADTTITTEYMHHETGYKAKFELNIEQTDSFAAYRDTTLEAMIVKYIPAVIEINSAAKFAEYVEIEAEKTVWIPESNAMNVMSSKVWFKWSGQSTFAFDFEAPIETSAWKIYEMYEDGTEQKTYDGPFYNGQHHEFAVSPNTYKLRLEGNNKLKNVRYFEYDTIDVDYHGITFFEDGADHFDITATYANKREVTVSLSAAAQEYFELRATGKPTGSSLVYNDADGLGVHKMAKDKVFTVAIKAGVDFAEAKAAAKNGFQVTLQDNYTFNSEIVVLPISMEDSYIVTYKGDANGSYKVTYHDDMEHPHTVSGSDYPHTVSTIVELYCTATLSEPIPASGYMFRGWKLNGALVSCKANYTLIPGNGAVVEPIFVVAEEAVYGIDAARFADLDEALSIAGSIADTKPVVVLLKDVTLSEAATHTIPAGVTLLIPYKANFAALQTTPEITTTATPLAAYRTLTLKEGVNIVVNGNLCVSAKIMAAGGGNKSAYTTGECGVINMATGGHIELNNGAQLYCWGYIKGQDMDQGNNTVGTGTITVNAGAVVHENFELGDWRGGTASSNIYFEKDDKRLFPFQSYALQNVEVPTTYTYGSKLETFMVVNTGFGSIPFAVSMIGSQNTLFLLQDEGSVIRKWYDPTTDLTCYELSGTAQLDQLVMNLPFVGEFESGDCNLPVSNSMHIILTDCNMTLSKRLMVQAGAVVEIKPTATIDLTAEVHLFDKDEWGKYIHNYYFRSFNNLTSHKDRGAENEKTGLDDAKFIVDGVLNVQNGGKLYATEGGANVMGNGGGEIHFTQALPAATQLWAVTVKSGKPYIEWESNDVAAANLCNEDGSYTKSAGYETYYNVHGRWFRTDLKDINDDHTYYFEYLSSNSSADILDTYAVYSHDKTGLEERMKWFNVTKTKNDCTTPVDNLEEESTSNWWIGTNPAAFYNFTELNEWHQFMPAEGEGIYSCSNNVLYHKDECTVTEEGYIDENCLYTFSGVKKALVNGAFIPLTSNGYDPAYHATANASQYYICFTGCNWHPATPYDGESKAYTIHPEDEDLHYIWFNNDWMNVLRDGSFFYTEDEQTNVRTYYAYVNGEWEVATPYVSVADAAETRTFYMIKEAFNVASIKKNATIKLLRDIPNVSEVLTYTTQNTTCTLDLNGHTLSGNIANLITVNAPGATFTITDNTDLKNGKISNAASKAVYVQKGTLVVTDGIIETTAASANAIEGAASTTININGGYFAATSKCVHTAGTCAISGGYFNKDANLVAYAAEHKYPFETTDPKYRWEVSDVCVITFMDGETTLQTLYLKPGEMPVYTANQPTKGGYKFTGWNTPIVAATADATYTAQFAAIAEGTKCVTFNSNGGNEGLQYVYVASGSAIGTLPTATKDGYTFDGWFTEASAGTQITSATEITADVTYYAHYTIASYTLIWDANGGELSGEYTHGTVEYGATITAPTATKEGHTFLRWNVTPAATMPAANTTYTAQWSIAVKHYLQNIDGTYPETPEATENISGDANEYVTPAVKTYDGFITPATQTVQIGVATEVTYQYVRRSYTITLDANGGTCATTSLTVKHSATPTLPVATKNGANCTGWFTKAIGGDQVTNETEILFNIGTLYAQYADLNVTAPLTVTDIRTVGDVRITTTGSLNVTGTVNATNFILESDGVTASGQLLPVTGTLNITGHAYFDLKLNAKNHQWYAVAVPWQVNAQTGISANGRVLTLGTDFDIIYYNGARRAAEGKNKCWSYVEDDGDKTLVPGKLYMIGLMQDAATIRFTKKADADLLTTTTSVRAHAQTTGNENDANWNGVANPALFHAYVNSGAVAGQVYNSTNKSYEAFLLNENKLVVGQGAYVQAPADKNITVSYGGAYAAPRRTRANDNTIYDVRIAPEGAQYTDRLFLAMDEEKEAEGYVIGQDLAKVGVSKTVAQMWISRYNTELCMNTVAPVNGVAEYPLGISVPANGEYTISNVNDNDDYTLYLTLNGEAIWDLSDAPYTLGLTKGTTNAYGLRISAKAPQVVTGVDEAVVDAKGETRKVLINDQVFIIRGNEVYTIDGQLVK